MSQKKDRRFLQSQKLILEAGMAVLLENPSAGMSEIADRAGVGRATLYRHFDSREVLIRSLALQCLKQMDEAVKPYEHLPGRALIEAIIEATVPVADRFRFLVQHWPSLDEDPELARMDEQLFQQMSYVFDQAKKRGEIRKELPNVWLNTLLDATFFAAWELISSNQINVNEAIGLIKETFFSGCKVSQQD